MRTVEDNGGVHINSGILNHAFVVLAKALGGKAWEKAGLIWYETATDARLSRSSTVRQFATLTHGAARRLYGPGSEEADAVGGAWGHVEISWA